jgi:hypothetical protein
MSEKRNSGGNLLQRLISYGMRRNGRKDFHLALSFDVQHSLTGHRERYLSDVLCFTLPYPQIPLDVHSHLRCPSFRLSPSSPPPHSTDISHLTPTSALPHRHWRIMLMCPAAHLSVHIFVVTPTISDVPCFTVPYPHELRARHLHPGCRVPLLSASTSQPALYSDMR